MLRTLKANSVSGYTLREETRNGRSYYVVPMVAVVEGVHAGLSGIFFYPASEIESNVASWNGAPLPVGHPVDPDGTIHSIQEGNFLQRLSIGFADNMTASNGRLTGEAWIDISRAQSVAGGPDVIAAVRAGQPLEVSTSMFADAVGDPGIWHNEQYEATLVGYVPDHIAILPGAVGACSIADGCGIRANKNLEHRGEAMKNFMENLSKKAAAALRAAEASFGAIREQLSQWVNAQDTPERINWVEDIYQEYFVHELVVRDPVTQQTIANKMYKREYTVDNKGIVTVAEEAVEVVQKVEYIPVANAAAAVVEPPKRKTITHNQEEIKAMEKKKIIDALIACNCTRFSEADRPWLDTLDEARLNSLAAPENVIVKPAEAPIAAAAPIDPPKAEAKPQTADEYIEAAPAEIRSVLKRAVANEKVAKAGIVAKLVENKNCAFAKEELEGKPLDELQALAKLAQVEVPEPDYSGQAGNARAGEAKRGAPVMPQVTMPEAVAK